MLSISTGHDVGYLTKAVAQAREGYYTGAVAAGEPPGLWFGGGARALGLDGEVDADLMEAVYTNLLDPRDAAAHSRSTWGEAAALGAGHRKYRTAEEIYKCLLEAHPDAGPEERAELRAQADRSARQAVSFIDVTFSVPKSVTVLGVAFERAANDAAESGDQERAAAWSMHAKAVEDAAMAGARAAIEYLQKHAGYSRIGHHGGGAGRWIDAHDFVVAQFLQHDSRDRDPQLHVHQAILNRVLCADGTWRALDSRAIHALRGAAGAIAERVMETHLTRSLGVEFATRPDGKAREVIGVPSAVIDLFSSRRRAVTARTAALIAEFEQANGRAPSPAERYYIAQQATLATRAAKSHEGETREQQLARWTRQCREIITGGLTTVAHDVVERAQRAEPPAEWSPRDVIARALAAVSETKQAWSRSALLRAVSDALPGNLGIGPDEVEELLDGLTDAALAQALPVTAPDDTTNLPASELLTNGQSPYTAPTGALFTTDGQLSAEHALRAAAVERGAVALPATAAEQAVQRYAESGVTLGADQAAALRGVLTSGARIEVLKAAAGTGKSFVVGAIADAWTRTEGDAPTRRVFGLAPYQVAAEVLADEGLTTKNVAAWLAAQGRLDSRRPDADGEDEPWRLREGDLVVVDEAGTAETAALAEIQQRCAAAGAKLLLVGDPRQLTAIGPGGALADVAARGISYELTEVRRFNNGWERTASLRLREGDASVLAEYDKHGRIVDGGTAEQAEAAAARGWLADTLAGKESLLLVGTNAAAARISAALRAELVALGRVAEEGVPLGIAEWDGVTAGVGDLVQARALAWHLRGFEGNAAAPITRQTYRVLATRDDGGLTVAPILRRLPSDPTSGGWNEELGTSMQLPGSYVREHLSLGYASTRDAAQGRTVDTSHSVNGTAGSAAGLYVPATRGRERNTLYVITRDMAPDADTGQTHDTLARSPIAVLADTLEVDLEERTALAEREQAEVDARSTMTHVDRLVDVVAREITAGRTAAALDQLTAEGALTPRDREALAADDAFGSLERLLRTAELAGHDPDAVLRSVVTDGRGLADARSPAQVLHHRITTSLAGRLTPQISDMADLIPANTPPEWQAWLHDRAEAATTRRHELGAETAADAPRWAVEALGPVPEDVVARQEWERRAGWAAAYRELVGHTDQLDPLGNAPAHGLVEHAALFRAAHRELGLIDAGAEEAILSDGQLRARVRAWEREQIWAPRWVDDDLAAAHQRREQANADATVWAARADAPDTAAEDAAQLRAAAETARAEVEQFDAQIADLEAASNAYAVWLTHVAVTRDNGVRSAYELRARGIDPDDPDDRVTAEEWIDAHRAEQADADRHREVREVREVREDYELTDDVVDAKRGVESAERDIRETSTPDPSRHADPAIRRRVLTLDQTADAVARAQTALAEVTARQDADAKRIAEEAAEAARLNELGRWRDDATSSNEATSHDAGTTSDRDMVRDW